jgi:hypothetical protein
MKGQTKNHHSSAICPPQMVLHFEGKKNTHSNGHLAIGNEL